MNDSTDEAGSDLLELKCSRNLDHYELFGVVLWLVVYKACTAYFTQPHIMHSVLEFYFHILNYIGVTMVLWIMLLRDPTWTPPLSKGAKSITAQILLGIFLFAVLYISARGIDGILHAIGIVRTHREREEFNVFLKSVGSVGYFSHNFSALFSSLYEEVLYRVYLLHRLAKYFESKFWPLLLSSLAFAAAHGYQLPGAIVIFYYGIAFGVVYYLVPRLPVLWVAHWLLDLL